MMCGFDSLPFEKKSVIPIDPRTKIFLTVTVSTIMIAGGTGGMMNVIRPCLMALPMCLFLLSKRWKTVLKFSITYLVLFSMEITLLPLLTGMWNFLLGAAVGIYTHMLPGVIMGYYLIDSTTVSEFVAAMENCNSIVSCIPVLSYCKRGICRNRRCYENAGDYFNQKSGQYVGISYYSLDGICC